MYQSFNATRKENKDSFMGTIRANQTPDLTSNNRYRPFDDSHRFRSIEFSNSNRLRNTPNNQFQVNFKNRKKLTDVHSPRAKTNHFKAASLFEKLHNATLDFDKTVVESTRKEAFLGSYTIDPLLKDSYNKKTIKYRTKVVKL